MSASDPKIDLMELADIGQPKKLALELHRQLREQYGKVPCRVPLRGIASAVGIIAIEEHDLAEFDGTLVIVGDHGAISIRRGQSRGRRNFTLGHELGHFLNPWHRARGLKFQCTKTDMTRERGSSAAFDARPPLEKIEVEANEFAAALLIPAPEFREERARLGKEADLAHVQSLKETFDVSLEFMARTFVQSSREKIAAITSCNGAVKGIYPCNGFPYLGLRKGAPIPSSSVTQHFARTHAPGVMSSLREISPSAWLDQSRDVAGFYEQVLVQRDGWALTLLVVEQDEPDDEADDRNWNRRNRRSD